MISWDYRDRKSFSDPIILLQWNDYTNLEARGRKIFYDPIIRLHFAELTKEKKDGHKQTVHQE